MRQQFYSQMGDYFSRGKIPVDRMFDLSLMGAKKSSLRIALPGNTG